MMKREAVSKVVKFMIAYTLLTYVFLFLISHSVLSEHAHVTGFGNIFVHFLDGSSL